MTMLGGWTRLGIVLSTVWMLAVLSFVAIEYRSLAAERTSNLALPAPPKGFVIEPSTQRFFFSWQPVDLLAPDSSAYVREFKLNIGRSACLLIGLPAGIWVFVWLTVFLSRWVRKGFTANHRDG